MAKEKKNIQKKYIFEIYDKYMLNKHMEEIE